MKQADFTLVVESWRGLAHSYALVNQYQCLEFLKIKGLRLYHRDLPYFAPHWTSSTGLFSPENEALLGAIEPPPPGLVADATLRIAYPYDFSPSPSRKLCVFGTAENKLCPADSVVGSCGTELRQALRQSSALLLTPSEWSKAGFLRSGADDGSVAVVPHGVDPAVFHPAQATLKNSLRARLGLQPDEFVFLNIGSLSPNKGSLLLLQAFAELASKTPKCRLILKFNGALYSPKTFIESVGKLTSPAEKKLLEPRLVLLGEQHSLQDIARLYQASDAYVAPYYAEGFNMPALEACACGLPVICTQGGPTDEFLPSSVLRPISSREQLVPKNGLPLIVLQPDRSSLIQQMRACLEDADFCRNARLQGPAHVASSYTWAQSATKILKLLNFTPASHP